MNYKTALDLIFRSFIAAKPYIQGKFDREVRTPHTLLNVAGHLDILPDPERVIKVTGSKGKGTVARLCAHGLLGRGKVGLVVSPEEIDHTDRMQIDGQAISEDRFATCFEKIWDAVEEPEVPQYLSPYGLFLLTALMWFKEEEVEIFVIETGRGVRFDEGGQLSANLGVVTSVFLEHAGYLGPALKDIRSDKLSISETCKQVIVTDDKVYASAGRPAWYAHSQHIAKQALEAFLDEPVTLPDGPCASFGQRMDDYGRTWIYEGLIARDSADETYLQKLINQFGNDLVFYVSLPDDKDIQGVCGLLDELGADVQHIILTGERGVLSYEQASRFTVAYKGAYDNATGLVENLDVGTAKAIYFIGTQTYLRLVKRAFFS